MHTLVIDIMIMMMSWVTNYPCQGSHGVSPALSEVTKTNTLLGCLQVRKFHWGLLSLFAMVYMPSQGLRPDLQSS